jgi:hypothetical protein
MSQLTEAFFVIIHFAVAALSTRVRRSIDGARAQDRSPTALSRTIHLLLKGR